MTLKPSLIAAMLMLILFSCSNDSTEDNNPIDEPIILLKERIFDYGGGYVLTEYFSYDTNNNLTSISYSDGSKNEYIYENDLLKRINYISDIGSLIQYTVLEYDSANRLNSYTAYVTSGNDGLRFDFIYNSDGTITRKEYIGDHNSQTSLIDETIITLNNGQTVKETSSDFESTYDYDSKNGIFKNVSNIATLNIMDVDFSGYIDSAENNLLKVTENDSGSIVVYQEYQYTYNSSNYPETATYYIEGELDSTIKYIYE